MKKLIAFLLSATLAASVFCLFSQSAFALTEELSQPRIVMENVTAAPGEEVVLSVDLVNNPGLINVKLSLEYDHEVFTLTEIEDGGLFTELLCSEHLSDDPLVMIFSDDTALADITADGTLVVLKFSTDEQAAEETYDFVLSCTDTYDQQLNSKTVSAAENTVTLAAPTPLEILNQPQNYSGAVNTSTVLSVSASGSGLTYQWQVCANGSTWKNVTSTGYNKASMTVTLTAARNGYQYRCVITDALQNQVISDPAALTIEEELTITAQPQNYTGAVNTNAVLSVSASGSGLTYQWQVCTNGSTWKNVTSTGYNKAAMTVTLTAARNGYQYRCVVKDLTGATVTSDPATIAVGEELTITAQPQNYTGAVNTNAVLSVSASGSGLTYQWQVCTNGSTWKNVTSTGYNKASMTVTLTAARNGYQYRCVVKDLTGAAVTSDPATIAVGGTAVVTG